MKNNIVVVFSSHYSEEFNNDFIKHIDKTIGVRHKTICYPNFNQFSLAQIYNQAIQDHSEKDCIFVCCHNDIWFKTMNWGKTLLSKFNNTNFDIIGVAGSTYLPESGKWWEDPSKMLGIVEHTNGLRQWVSQYSKEIHAVKETVLIDGLFMSFNPETIVHRFDESYKGFHFYDLSFCVPNYLDGCDIGVTTSIRILHESVGQTNEQWEINRQQFVTQWVQELPITIPPPYRDLNPKLKETPKVSVIIPTKNNLKYIENNLYSWRNNVMYDNYEIIIADTGSEEDVIAAYKPLLNNKVKLVRYDYYNFGKINNDVVRNHVSDDTELLLFCNDDVYLLNDALSRCVEIYNKHKADAGTIGIRLHFGDASIQHNGIMIVRDPEGNVRLGHKDFKRTEGYSTSVNTNSKGNTGGFMLIKKSLFEELGGFNENYIECLEDVELNLMCRHKGLKNITVSDAVAFHYESVSRNKLQGKDERFAVDFERLNVFINENQIKI
jgi:GT2 family glycosyltransferase